jgi:hypothetical protein
MSDYPIADSFPTIHNFSKVATFEAASTKTAVVDLEGYCLVGFWKGADIVGTSFTFESAPSPTGTFMPVYTEGNTLFTVTGTTLTAQKLNFEPKWMNADRFIKIVSNAAANGDATKSMTLALRSV